MPENPYEPPKGEPDYPSQAQQPVDGSTSHFWVRCSIVFAMALIAILLCPRAFRGRPYPLWGKALAYAALATIIGVAWAICFRPQVEKGRMSIMSLFSLIGMEALLFWFIRRVGTFD